MTFHDGPPIHTAVETNQYGRDSAAARKSGSPARNQGRIIEIGVRAHKPIPANSRCPGYLCPYPVNLDNANQRCHCGGPENTRIETRLEVLPRNCDPPL